MSRKQDEIKERTFDEAKFLIDNNATVRETAKKFGISKSTVHRDITERLTNYSSLLASEVREVLNLNKEQRHLRGGMATKQKYLKQKSEV